MKNNDGKGLYDIGERQKLSCGCVVVAEKTGYTHYVEPGCRLCDVWHPNIAGYHYHHQEAANEPR